MAKQITRREILRGSLAATGLAAMGVPEWALPALAQGEMLVPFTDIPENFNTNPSEQVRFLDIRKIDGPFTPRDQFFAVQHYGQPEIDGASFRLKVTGLVAGPMGFSISDLLRMAGEDLAVGFECSGNSPRRIHGLVGNGRWTGVPVRTLLNEVGVKPAGREVVFFGADKGEEEVEFRGRTYNVEQEFGRSISIETAMTGEPLLAYALNGEPLTRHQGFPLRVIMPGWYGVANVKWLAHIHVQEKRYLGKYQARWYRTLRAEMIDGEVKYKETAISKLQLKSVIARVTQEGNRHKVLGFVLNDGTPLRSVEVKVDDGAWRPAAMDSSNTKYSWKLFSYMWNGATPGEHTLVSRVTDENGNVQRESLDEKMTGLENHAQFPRTVMIG